jgi:SAM-dependent methyltransferase
LDSIVGQSRHQLILDACAGSGCESIYLRKKGLPVISNEIDLQLLSVAQRAAQAEGVTLSCSAVDWRELCTEFGEGKFTTALLMGNSLGLMEEPTEIRRVLREVLQVLRPGGHFVVDQRNYDYILNDREEILSGRFRYSRKFIYCGRRITGRPIAIEDDRVEFGYFGEDNVRIGVLSMIPLREKSLNSMLLDAGFKDVERLYDFSKRQCSDYDFITYVATK